MGKVGDPAGGHNRVFFTGIVKELFKLMASDIAQDTAVFLPLKEPSRPSRSAQPVRTESGHGNHLADFPALRDISRQDGSLVMQPFRVVNHIFLSGFLYGFPGGFQLGHGGKRRLVGKVVLSRIHGPQSQSAPFTGNGCSGNHLCLSVFKGFLFTVCGLCLRKSFQESSHFLFVRIINIFQRAACLCEAVAHPVNMSVVQPHSGEYKFSGLHYRLGLPFWCIVHSV